MRISTTIPRLNAERTAKPTLESTRAPALEWLRTSALWADEPHHASKRAFRHVVCLLTVVVQEGWGEICHRGESQRIATLSFSSSWRVTRSVFLYMTQPKNTRPSREAWAGCEVQRLRGRGAGRWLEEEGRRGMSGGLFVIGFAKHRNKSGAVRILQIRHLAIDDR